MKFVFRGCVIFEYIPNVSLDKVVQHRVHGIIPAFDHCSMIDEDYKMLALFFDVVYRHIKGEGVVLKDIEV